MKCSLVYHDDYMRQAFELIDMAHGVENVIPDMTVQHVVDNCWVFALLSDDEKKVKALVLLDWVDEGTVEFHMATFNRVNFFKAFDIICERIEPYVHTINAYIPLDRPDVAKIASKAGFNVKMIEGIYHGQCKPFQKSKSEDSTKAKASCANGYS